MGGELMTIETVDNVLHALMSAGGEKIDWKRVNRALALMAVGAFLRVLTAVILDI